MKYKQLCSFLLVVGSLLGTHGEVVTLPGLGDIEGSTTQSYLLNRTIYQFQGIPYAKPPVGELRFKRPQKWSDPWTEKRNCTSFKAVCAQLITYKYPPEELSEDCLHINVYTNQLWGGGNGTGQAVMFYIHGGSFRVGSARPFTPEYLLDEDVVLVVLQYRLGPLGFLSLKTDDIPGNMGMLDMILALEWVRDNIHVFGGDANRVTLFGNSAGAAAVSLLPFSPLVKDGLIQRIIMQSGSPLATWAVDADPVTHARGIIKLTDCSEYRDDNLISLYICLRNLPFEDLIEAQMEFLLSASSWSDGDNAGHAVVWDEAGEKSFLRQDPAILLQEGKLRYLPMMAGITKHEGSAFLSDICGDDIDTHSRSSSTINFLKYDVITTILKYCGIADRTGYLESVLQDKYFKENEMGNLAEMLPGLVDIIGVGVIKAPVVSLAKAICRRENTYLYSFNFYGSHCGESFSQGPLLWSAGIAHEDELLYLFPQGKVLNIPESTISRRMVQLWTSFAKTGVPEADDTPDWPPMSTLEGPYLSIDKVPKVLQGFVEEEFMSAVNDRATAPALSQASGSYQRSTKNKVFWSIFIIFLSLMPTL